jgi:hypothetical protein
MVHDPLDEGGGAGRAGEDRVPVGEGQVGGEDEAFLFVSTADDLEDEIRVSVVEGEKAELVDLCGAPHKSTHVEHLVM